MLNSNRVDKYRSANVIIDISASPANIPLPDRTRIINNINTKTRFNNSK